MRIFLGPRAPRITSMAGAVASISSKDCFDCIVRRRGDGILIDAARSTARKRGLFRGLTDSVVLCA